MDSIATPDWDGLPVPLDDGAARHLVGAEWPMIGLLGTNGALVDLSRLKGWGVVYVYPRTGRSGIANPAGWDLIPGARGCTPQSCGFRDLFAELKGAGVEHLFGLSTQESEYQHEAAERLHLPFPLLSDAELKVTRALGLPTFEVEGMVLLKRLTMVIRDRKIEHVFYPVFPPDRNARDVVEWMARNLR